MDEFDFHDNEFEQQHSLVMVHVLQDQLEYQKYLNNSK